MWFCFVAIGFVAAFVIIVSLWEKFQTNPTITGNFEIFLNMTIMMSSVTSSIEIFKRYLITLN